MADYYSLLARAVGNLPQSTPDTRRAIYERARAALLGQLRGLVPPPPDADIARESIALDAAVARLEAEIAAKANLPSAVADAGPAISAASAAPMSADVAAAAGQPGPIALASPALPGFPKPAEAFKAAGEPAQEPVHPASQQAASQLAAAKRLAGPPRIATRAKAGPAAGTWRLWGLAALAAIVVAGVGTAAYILPNPPFNAAGPKAAAPAPVPVPDARPGKIGGRIDGAPAPGDKPAPAADMAAPPTAPNSPPASPQPAAGATPPTAPADSNPALPVAPRAALLVQTGEDAQNVKAFVGTVVWRIDTASGGAGQALQNSIRAEVDIPEARFKAVLVIQNNTDATLPASHTISIRFQPASDGAVGNVKAIDVPELREDGAQSGVRLIGTSLPITENNFLAALVRGDQALPRNLDLLRTRPWLDIPMKLANNKLAKLTMEKGLSGDRVIAEALAAWEK